MQYKLELRYSLLNNEGYNKILNLVGVEELVASEAVEEHSAEDNSNASTQEELETNLQLLELQRKLKSCEKQIRHLHQETETLKQKMHSVFNEDQIQYLKRGRMTGRRWQTDTIKKCLKLYLLSGTTAYEELRTQNYPIPSIRTLQRRMEGFKFEPGILHDLFPLLETKIHCMKPEERYAVLLMDEMALKPGLQYDHSTGKILGMWYLFSFN